MLAGLGDASRSIFRLTRIGISWCWSLPIRFKTLRAPRGAGAFAGRRVVQATCAADGQHQPESADGALVEHGRERAR